MTSNCFKTRRKTSFNRLRPLLRSSEIWQHTDADNPSDEDDIIRVQDDFGRQKK